MREDNTPPRTYSELIFLDNGEGANAERGVTDQNIYTCIDEIFSCALGP